MTRKLGHLFAAAQSDGQTRVTRSEDFTVVGGTKEHHEYLQEKSAKLSEELNKHGEKLTQEDFSEILERVWS